MTCSGNETVGLHAHHLRTCTFLYLQLPSAAATSDPTPPRCSQVPVPPSPRMAAVAYSQSRCQVDSPKYQSQTQVLQRNLWGLKTSCILINVQHADCVACTLTLLQHAGKTQITFSAVTSIGIANIGEVS